MLMPTDVLYPEGRGDARLIGDVDWATGIVRMHVPYDEWRRLASGPAAAHTETERQVLEALSHEYTHVLQFATTGYAYELSRTCLQQVVAAFHELGTLHGVYEQRERFTALLEPAHRKLEARGPDGISALDLLEGQAFAMQKLMHWKDLGPRAFEQMLNDEAPAAIYRAAYDVAVAKLREDALTHFVHVTNLALMTTEPQTVFVPLLDEIARKGSRSDTDHNQAICMQLLNAEFADLLLGHALERIAAGHRHPVLEGIALVIDDRAGEDMSPIAIYARPHRLTQLWPLVVGPTMFPPDPSQPRSVMHVPQHWLDRQDAQSIDPKYLQLFAAGSALLLMDLAPPPYELPQPRDVQAQYDMPVTLRNWTFRLEDLTDTVADNFARSMRDLAQDAASTRMVRGTAVISFDVDEHADSPYADPLIRGFVRRLYEQVPHLLYFLTEAPDQPALLGCAAAHAPDDAVTTSGDVITVRLNSMEVTRALMSRFQAAAIFAIRIGDDPRMLLGHLRGLEDPGLRRLLEQVVVDPALAHRAAEG
jgi:hypothetical protein